jgi:dipeptidase E
VKLYLSSYRVPTPDALFALLPKPPTECSIAVIPNAQDDKLPQERAQRIDELIYDLAKFGFKTEVIDLREYDEGQSLREQLQGHDVVWAAGGNTFVLRSEMHRSGFDAIIRELLENGLVYCGESAGAIVAGLTLKGTEIADDPDLADELIWEGLALMDKIIIPHADNANFQEYINHIKKQYDGDSRVVYLNDDQAIVQG